MFMTEAAQRAFADAIVAIEKVSSAEVVVAVRPYARRWLWPAIVLGGSLAFAVHAYMLYSETEFSLWAILLLPFLVGIAAGFVAAAVPPLYRALAPKRMRDEHVRLAARGLFVERGIHGTRDRTGMLVYIALLERRIEIVPDIGVERAIPADTRARWIETLEGQIAEGGEAVATTLGKLASQIGSALPAKGDDRNELADGLVMLPRGLRGLLGKGKPS